MIKRTAAFFAALFFCTFVYSQEIQQEESQTEESAADVQAAETEEFKLKNWDFFFTLAPILYVNTDKNSAPSPVAFSGGLGLELFNNFYINFQPKLSFFTGYYLWDGKNARPAEIENRTALAFCGLLDLDASHTWIFKKNAFQAGGGISILARYALAANGVSGDQAGEDVKNINSWFYSGLNCLYPNIALSWMRQLESKWHAGFEARFYLPLGALTSDRGMDTMMATFGVKVCSK